MHFPWWAPWPGSASLLKFVFFWDPCHLRFSLILSNALFSCTRVGGTSDFIYTFTQSLLQTHSFFCIITLNPSTNLTPSAARPVARGTHNQVSAMLMRQWMITNIYITLLTSKTQETRWEREPTFKSVRPRVISSRPWMSWAEKTPRYSSKSRECSHLDTSSTDHWDTRHKHQSHNNSLTPDMHIELTPNTLY